MLQFLQNKSQGDECLKPLKSNSQEALCLGIVHLIMEIMKEN